MERYRLFDSLWINAGENLLGMEESRVKKIRGQMSESLVLGLLLAVAGGFFDAYTYLCRGGVFANAQTGNIVLFGARLAEGDWRKALTYLLPILAFAFGVLTAEAVKRRYKSRQNRDINIHWRQIVVMVEIALVVVAAMLPQKLNPTVNIIISFVCAMQVETFRKVRGSAFATTMCTGNLRSGTEQFIIWQQTGDKTAKKKMRNYYSIILIFILGGAIGTLSTHALGEKALLLTLVPLLSDLSSCSLRRSARKSKITEDRHEYKTDRRRHGRHAARQRKTPAGRPVSTRPCAA